MPQKARHRSHVLHSGFVPPERRETQEFCGFEAFCRVQGTLACHGRRRGAILLRRGAMRFRAALCLRGRLSSQPLSCSLTAAAFDCDMGIARARLAVAGGWAAALVFLDDSWQDLTAWTKPS
jgi:hypothetical protein